LPFLTQHLTTDCIKMWCSLLTNLQLHNIVCGYTINLLLFKRESCFKKQLYIINMLSEFKDEPTRSVMCYGVDYNNSDTCMQEHFFSKEDVYNLFNRFFPNSRLVPDALCVRIDNFFMVTIEWFIRYVVETGNWKEKFTMGKFYYFYSQFLRQRVPQYESDILPFYYNHSVITGISNTINLGLHSVQKDHKNFKIDLPVIRMLLVMTHVRLTSAVAGFLLSNINHTEPNYFASECINLMNDYDYKHIFLNDKLLEVDKPLFILNSNDGPDYEAHHLNTIRNPKRSCNFDTTNMMDEDIYEDFEEFTCKGIDDLYYGKNPEVTDSTTNSEYCMDSSECLDELSLEIKDLQRLAQISYENLFITNTTKDKMLLIARVNDSDKNNGPPVSDRVRYLNHLIHYDQYGRPKTRASAKKHDDDNENDNASNDKDENDSVLNDE